MAHHYGQKPQRLFSVFVSLPVTSEPNQGQIGQGNRLQRTSARHGTTAFDQTLVEK